MKGSRIKLDGYYEMARGQHDAGFAAVLSNESSHLLVVDCQDETETEALVIDTFEYLTVPLTEAYRRALTCMVERVLSFTSDAGPEQHEES
jgi:hypothetical protein